MTLKTTLAHATQVGSYGKRSVSLLATALTLAIPSLALAQGAAPNNCPPGSWFCADAQTPPPPAAAADGSAQALQPLPPPQAAQTAPAPLPASAPAAKAAAPPVVIYQSGPPVVVVRPGPDAPPPAYVYHPRPQPPRLWGLNLHLDAPFIAHASTGQSDGGRSAGMAGFGMELRHRPVPYFAVAGGVDFLFGRDYLNNQRGETALTASGYLFVNPRSRTQFYFVGGIGWAWAHVIDDHSYLMPYASDYTYFGGQLGAGLEFRLAPHFALNIDMRGFIRGRIDDGAHSNPEFTDLNGRTTNVSGGALLTAGMTYYF